MKRFLSGSLVILAVLAAAAGYVWRYSPESLPEEWRRANRHSRDYTPAVYRWKDDRGVVQLTDAPPTDRPYETLRIRPDQNVVPTLLPSGSGD
jgi:hypothetical protein